LLGASLLLGAGIIVVILDHPPLSQSRRRLDSSFLLLSPSLYLIVACEWSVRRMGLDCRQCRHCHPIPPEIPVGSGGRSGVAPPTGVSTSRGQPSSPLVSLS
jgi:hypothetical protein